MDPMLSLLVGPLCGAFQVIDKFGYLPEEDNFVEFSDEMYESFRRKCGMPDERMFYIQEDKPSAKNKQLEVVSLSEKTALIQAKSFIIHTFMSEIEKHPDWKDKDIIMAFKSSFPFLFPNTATK